MTVGSAIVYYLVRLIIFSAIAAAGIAIGIKIRKNKNAKDTTTQVEK